MPYVGWYFVTADPHTANPGVGSLVLTGLAPSVVITGDPDTSLLWHFNDDFSDTTDSYTFTGNDQFLNTTTYKFGGGAYEARDDDGGSYEHAQTGRVITEWDSILSGSWTVEGWFRPDGTADGDMVIHINDGTTFSALPAWTITLSGIFDQINWAVRETGIGNVIAGGPLSVTLTADVWYHWAIVRDVDAGTYSLYFNGNRIDQDTVATDPRTADNIWISGGAFTGQIAFLDELRISIVARYSGTTYTIPTAEFDNP